MFFLKTNPFFSLSLLLLCSFLVPTPPPTVADAITGEWYTEGQESVVTIYKKGDTYFGNISWVLEPRDKQGQLKRDSRNPDKSLRNRLITEVVLLHHFEFDGEETWTNGTIYNPEDGKDYSGRIRLIDPNTLSLRGYIGAPILGKSVAWKRKQD